MPFLIGQEKNNMVLNEKKFQLLNHRVHSHAPNVNMRLLQVLPFAEVLVERFYSLPNSEKLFSSDSVTDLGVLVSNNFLFESHINQIAQKANLKCSWILSVFHCREETMLLTLFKSLVLGILEYSSPLWSPNRVQDIAKLESVQRRFTSKILSIQHLSYGERLQHLKLMSLQRRRERYQIIYLWKVMNEKVPNDINFSWRENARRGKVAEIQSCSHRL